MLVLSVAPPQREQGSHAPAVNRDGAAEGKAMPHRAVEKGRVARLEDLTPPADADSRHRPGHHRIGEHPAILTILALPRFRVGSGEVLRTARAQIEAPKVAGGAMQPRAARSERVPWVRDLLPCRPIAHPFGYSRPVTPGKSIFTRRQAVANWFHGFSPLAEACRVHRNMAETLVTHFADFAEDGGVRIEQVDAGHWPVNSQRRVFRGRACLPDHTRLRPA